MQKMKTMEKEHLRVLSGILKALSHPTRLWMVEELSEKERCVHEFVESSHFDFSTVSKHLSVLRQAGIIRDEKRGKNVYYHLHAHCAMTVINCIKDHMQQHHQGGY
ncbi:MAG: metalloregulator ArsR/SmtB family transcription factor [Fidelibacterota bacterium]